MGAIMGRGSTHWTTLFLERVVRQVAQRADALGFRNL
jgi:hypothetical protein